MRLPAPAARARWGLLVVLAVLPMQPELTLAGILPASLAPAPMRPPAELHVALGKARGN